MSLTHFHPDGSARMVDVGGKAETRRTARASGLIRMSPSTLVLIREHAAAKGDVEQVARLAGIMAAKKTSDLIPLCHPLPLTSVTVNFRYESAETMVIEAEAAVFGRTGVEMEALTAVTVAALTVYDMCKAFDRGMTIERIRLEEKDGGQNGRFLRSPDSLANNG